jgi:hypothetical protein
MSDLGEQIQINVELNRLINERSALLATQSDIIIQQIDLYRMLLDTMSSSFGEEHVARLSTISSSMNAAADSTSLYSAQLSQVSESLSSAAKHNELLGKSMTKGAKDAAMFVMILKGLGATLDRVKTVTKSSFNFTKTLIASVFEIGKALISLPLRIHDGLVETANEIVDISPVSLALEEVRKQFGDLDLSTGAIIKDTFRPMVGEFNNLAAAGHSFAKTFGMGREGLAAAIKFNAELMGALKDGSYELRKEIGENIAEHAIYRKSLGMTAEQQANLIHLAKQQGKSATEVQQEYAKFAINMGKRFGFSAKEMGSAMAEMSMDVANFGTLSTKQLAQVAVYTKKLGIETKQLLGLINKYDNFEDAAKAVSMLNQSFGMQVDVLKMMREEDPAARLRQLQNSFMVTGRAYDSLSRVERKRLADLAGLDESAARAAFSQQGLSMSYEEIAAAGDDTESATKSLDSTMKELSKNMEKILQLGRQFKGFFDALINGFTFGFLRGTGMFKVLTNIRASLYATYQEGKRLGVAFGTIFPGMQKIIEGLTEFYDPTKWKARMGRIVDYLEKFFKIIQDPKKIRGAFTQLWTDLSNEFTSLFSPDGSTNQKLMQGLDEFATTMGNIALVFADKLLDVSAKFLNAMADIFSGEKTFSQAFGDQFGGSEVDGLMKGLEERFGENFDSLSKTFTEKFGPAILRALENFITWLGPHLKRLAEWMAPYIWEGLKAIWNAMPTEMKIAVGLWKFGPVALAIVSGLTAAFGAAKWGWGKIFGEALEKGADDAAKAAAKGGLLGKVAEKLSKLPKKGKIGTLAAVGTALMGGAVMMDGNQIPAEPPSAGPKRVEGPGLIDSALLYGGGMAAAKAAALAGASVPFVGSVVTGAFAAKQAFDMATKEGETTAADWTKLGILTAGTAATAFGIPGVGGAAIAADLAGEFGGYDYLDEKASSSKTPNLQKNLKIPPDQLAKLAKEAAPPELKSLEETIGQKMMYSEKVNFLLAQVDELSKMEKKLQEASLKIPGDQQIEILRATLSRYVEKMNKATEAISKELSDLYDPQPVVAGMTKISAMSAMFEETANSLKKFTDMELLPEGILAKKLKALYNEIYWLVTRTNEFTMQPFYELLEDLDIDEINEKGEIIKGLVEAFNAISNNMTLMAQIPDIKTKVADGLNNLVTSVSSFYFAVKRADGIEVWASLIEKNLDAANTRSGLAKINDYITELNYNQLMIGSLAKTRVNVADLQQTLTDLQTSLSMMHQAQTSFDANFVDVGIANVDSIISNINRINNAIKGIKSNDVQAIVDINETLNGNKQMTIKHENLSLNLNVQVTMDAKELVAGIVQVDKLPTKEKVNWAPLFPQTAT